MASSFGGYSVALTGMTVNQTVLATISHNLANISTTGYSRQQVSTAELVTKQSGGTTTGSGTNVESVTRARDMLLDKTYYAENAKLSYCEAKSSNIETVESLLGDFTATTDDTTTETEFKKTCRIFSTAGMSLRKIQAAPPPENQCWRRRTRWWIPWPSWMSSCSNYRKIA